MKKIILLLVLLLGFMQVSMAGNGAFVIIKSAYLYENNTKIGKKILTRKKNAYDVIDIAFMKQNKIMLKIKVPFRRMTINGSGFILESDPELKKSGEKPIKVYKVLPNNKSDLLDFQLIPSNKLLFAGKQTTNKDFPNLIFRAVNYKAKIPAQLWVNEWAGIYRPDKDSKWLIQTLKKLHAQKIKSYLQKKILQGLVETGFSREQVKMALGDPEKELFSEDGKKLEWVYPDRNVFFEKNKVVRIF